MGYRTGPSLTEVIFVAVALVCVIGLAGIVVGAVVGRVELLNPTETRMAEERQRVEMRWEEEDRQYERSRLQTREEEALIHRREMNRVKSQLCLVLGYALSIGLVLLAAGYAARLIAEGYLVGRAKARQTAELHARKMARWEARQRETMERMTQLAQALAPVPMPPLSHRGNGGSAVTATVSAND